MAEALAALPDGFRDTHLPRTGYTETVADVINGTVRPHEDPDVAWVSTTRATYVRKSTTWNQRVVHRRGSGPEAVFAALAPKSGSRNRALGTVPRGRSTRAASAVLPANTWGYGQRNCDTPLACLSFNEAPVAVASAAAAVAAA